jgi:uncharacterized protein (TIGR02646 family)
MKRLKRGPAPDVLRRFKGGRDHWDDMGPDGKEEVWVALFAMQGEVCAYCEARVTAKSRHIEHFKPRKDHSELTFEWRNLFGNCGNTDTCGHRKDSRKVRSYDSEDLIKPDEEDPDFFFRFVVDGSIVVREGLDARRAGRARETLRILGIDEPGQGLRQRRRDALVSYVQFVDDWTAVAEACTDAELQEIFEAEVAKAQGQEFSTAIRHLLLGPRNPTD